MNLLIVGCGYVGQALALRAAAAGWRVWGVRRNVSGLRPPIIPLPCDVLGDDTAGALAQAAAFDAVVVCIAPGRGGGADAYARTYVEGSRHILTGLANAGQRPRRIVFTSSTGVYPQDDGSWVDETSATAADGRGGVLMAAEALYHQGPWPACVVRFAGIYGPERALWLKAVRDGTAAWPAGPHYTNRVHRDDCAGILLHVLEHPSPGPTLIGCDDHPADKRDVLAHLAAEVGGRVVGRPAVPAPATGKRCRNTRLRQSGYTPAYPSYVEGYAHLVDSAPT